eukprot:1177755-Amorphochlora_amoeboformis.AAC.2
MGLYNDEDEDVRERLEFGALYVKLVAPSHVLLQPIIPTNKRRNDPSSEHKQQKTKNVLRSLERCHHFGCSLFIYSHRSLDSLRIYRAYLKVVSNKKISVIERQAENPNLTTKRNIWPDCG